MLKWVFAAVISLLTQASFAVSPAELYLAGLDALEAGKFIDAAGQFEKAIDEDDENADFRIAYGVALTLAEKLPEAEKALNRAIKLSNNADEARLWLATALAMQGNFDKGTEIYPFAIARNEYVNNIRRMSHAYGQGAFAVATAERNGNNQADLDYARQELAKRDGLRAGFVQLATSYSQRMKSKLPAGQRGAGQRGIVPAQEAQAVSDALMARIKVSVDRGDYAEALRDINPLLAGNADNTQLIIYHGLCTLNLGAPEIARRQFTRALYAIPLDPELHALRAVAAAQTGDQRRAALDLAVAEALGATRAGWAREQIAAAPREAGEPAALLQAMFDAAKSGAAYPELIDQATRLTLAQNARRLRLDEDYTDKKRDLQKAVNENPKDAARLAAFAAFLYDNAVSPRGEAVELRAPWRPYRAVDEAMVAAELTRSLNIANEALAVDDGNVSAMITKAAVLVQRMQLGDADSFLKKALSLAPTEPRLLRLFAEVADRAAAAKQAQASSLRTPTTWEDTLYIYTRYPSAADRAAADQLEAQANQLWAMARDALRQAVEQARTPADAAFFRAVMDRRDGRVDQALASARNAVELAPTNLEYLDMLSTLLVQTGQKVEALLNQARATNLIHSTAGPALKCVWFSLPRTKFKTSREYLAQASVFDAADPRIAAYYGAVAGADDKTDVAAAWYSVACAIYEARARFEGVSTDSKQPAPLRVDVAATMMNVNLRAITLLRATRPQDAQVLALANLGMEQRIDASALFAPVPASMLPDVDADQIPVPLADSVGYMLSVTRLELGRVLMRLKRYDEAVAQLEKVQSYREKVPPTVDAGSKMQYPIKAASIWRISAILASGNRTKAAEQFRYVGRPVGVDEETKQEYQRISAIVAQSSADDQARQDEEALRQQQQMLDEAMRERQRRIEEAERARRRPRG